MFLNQEDADGEAAEDQGEDEKIRSWAIHDGERGRSDAVSAFGRGAALAFSGVRRLPCGPGIEAQLPVEFLHALLGCVSATAGIPILPYFHENRTLEEELINRQVSDPHIS